MPQEKSIYMETIDMICMDKEDTIMVQQEFQVVWMNVWHAQLLCAVFVVCSIL